MRFWEIWNKVDAWFVFDRLKPKICSKKYPFPNLLQQKLQIQRKSIEVKRKQNNEYRKREPA